MSSWRATNWPMFYSGWLKCFQADAPPGIGAFDAGAFSSSPGLVAVATDWIKHVFQPNVARSLATAVEIEWIERALPGCWQRTAQVRESDWEPPVSAADEELTLLLARPFDAFKEREAELRAALTARLRLDVEAAFGALPTDLSTDGQAAPLDRLLQAHWYDLFRGSFHATLKTDQKVFNISQSQMLAEVVCRLQTGLTAPATQLTAKQFSDELATLNDNLSARFNDLLQAIRTEGAEIKAALRQGVRTLADNDQQILRLLTELQSKQFSAAEILSILSDRVESLLPPTPAAMHGNLPPRKAFFGRAALFGVLEERLHHSATINLTSLCGAPGVGKSALALECAYRFAQLFPDGQAWLDLRGGELTGALRNLLAELGLAHGDALQGGFADLCGLWQARMAGRRALLILDNAESVAAQADEQLRKLYLHAPGSTLITSRTTIETGAELRVDLLSEPDALSLLATHKVEVAAEPDAAAELCRRLGYLALALDITARRMALFSPPRTCAQMLVELGKAADLFALLRLPHKENVNDNAAASFALSYALLDDRLRHAFHALGLCAATGAPVAGLAQMLACDESSARDDALALGMLSLADCDGERIIMHPLLHGYAAARAHTQPETAQAMIVRHAAWFGAEIGGSYQAAVNEDRGAEADEALQRIDQERDNVALAQTRALAASFPEPILAVALTNDLEAYWRLRDEPQVLEWLQAALILAEQNNLTRQQANVLQAIGDVQSFRDDKDAALESYDAALKLFTQVGAKLGQANVYLALGQLQLDVRPIESAIALYEVIRDGYSLARGRFFLGLVLLQTGGDAERARELLEQARAGWASIQFDAGVEQIDSILQELMEDG